VRRLIGLSTALVLLAVPNLGGSKVPVSAAWHRPSPKQSGGETALEQRNDDLPGAERGYFPLFLRKLPPRPADMPEPSAPVVRRVARPEPLPHGRRQVVLTFDDGPDLETTPRILEMLDRRGIKAVFFVPGNMLVGDRPSDRARRHLLRKLVEHGHLVGNHTISHSDVCARPETIDREIDGNQEFLTAATGVRPRLFRSPYGARCRALDDALRARGLINVGWNVDPQEWRVGNDPNRIAETVIDQIRALPARGIVLFHDTKRVTVRALPRILDWIDTQVIDAAPIGPRSGVHTAHQAGAIEVVDYTVFLPEVALAHTGVEPILEQVFGALSSLPGRSVLGTGTKLR